MSAVEDMAPSKWRGPQEFLDKVNALKEAGTQNFKNKEIKDAIRPWSHAIAEAEALRGGNFWSRFTQDGGDHFIERVAELHFRLALNCAHIFLSASTAGFVSGQVHLPLMKAPHALQPGFWNREFVWRPSNGLRAKLYLRTARSFRLKGDLGYYEPAIVAIDQALRLPPDDPVLLKERHGVLAWASSQSWCCTETKSAPLGQKQERTRLTTEDRVWGSENYFEQ
ncbi:hypothetical protein diail_9229 [Diaporthe ilicicola]|nr:hypothetical protein diail_9229 [Diaporthe ilicicola]